MNAAADHVPIGGHAVFRGLRVVDLTQGIAGAITGMLLSDAGAEVIRIDTPDDKFATLSGYRVWHRGKRRARFDLSDPVDIEAVRSLIAAADVLIETFEENEAERLGFGKATPTATNPRLVHCSITGYGDAAAHAGRPAIDALVAARTGLQWEMRGIPGTTINFLSGTDDPMGGIEVDAGTMVGPDRPGPMYTGIPWVSNAAAYLATIAITAALHARERTGRGQHVATSLLQGSIAASAIAWQRVEHPDREHYLGWTTDPRAPKGFYRTRDEQWIQQWVQLPGFMLSGDETGELPVPATGGSPRDFDLRIETDFDNLVLLHHFHPQMQAAAARFTAEEWERSATACGIPFERVRPPEEALLDELMLQDGCVVELPDDEFGAIRSVGSVLQLHDCPTPITRGTVADGNDTDWVREQARTAAPQAAATGMTTTSAAGPLNGIRVLDLGLAIAGPYGAQLLGDLGADVIKVNPLHDEFWTNTQYSHMSNRGKRSIAIDLKAPEGRDAFYELVRQSDVVHHNMRYAAARRLGIDYDSLRAINSDLIYCHTRGYEHGPRDAKPANDQTAAATCGTEWVDGATDNGGTPLWPSISLGDTGNGLLSAVAVLEALYHRTRTGRGQFVETSIAYAHLLNASSAWITPDGRARGDRPVLDAQSFGISALQRIYPASDGWLCLAVMTDSEWHALCELLPATIAGNPLFASESARKDNDDALGAELSEVFATDTAQSWADLLTRHEIPCEACAPTPGTVLFDDPDLRQRGWMTAYQHPVMGAMEMGGRLFDFSATPTNASGPAPLLGQHTVEILSDLGFDEDKVEHLIAAGIVRAGAKVAAR